MDTYLMIAQMLGGLALFLYGMEVMGDGLKSSSASALKKALEKVTSNPVKSFVLGFLITAVIQSSTATIVLVVGLIGAGVLTLKQSVGIVMGANVGTTVTAQIIRLVDVKSTGEASATVLDLFTPNSLAPLAAIIGIVLIMFIKKGNSKNIGMIAMGFGVLFTGLLNMTTAMEPLTESDMFKELILKFSINPFYGLVIGMIVTFVIQSSSASVGILQSLAASGALVFNFAYAYVIGAALGTCITTAIICSIGTKEDAKRIGAIHIIFNIIGGGLCLALMCSLKAWNVFPALWDTNNAVSAGDIANFETLFKLATAIILLPFTPFLIKAAKAIVKGKPSEESDADIAENLRALNPQLLSSPVLALGQVKHLLCHMCELSIKNYDAGVKLLLEYDEKKLGRIAEREALIDRMADATNSYLLTLSPNIENPKDNQTQSFLLQTLTEFERIGDLAQNLANTAKSMAAESITFSEGAKKEFVIMTDAVREILGMSYKAFSETDFETAAAIEPLEEVIDDLNEMLRQRHIVRLKKGKCTAAGGIFYYDVLINLERLGDQCSDVAVYVLGLNDASITGNEHEYIRNLHKARDEFYAEEFKKNKELYIDKLDELA